MSSTSTLAPERPITTKDVALLAGVNRASVSVVLNGARSNSGVSEETRQRIIAAAESLGYRRNASGANMVSGRFGCVALLLSTRPQHSTLAPAVLQGIYNELAVHNLHLSLFCLPDQELTDRALVPKILREWMADGLIVDYTHDIPPRLIEMIDGHQLPVVWFNVEHEFDTVRPDDYGAGRQAARHLLDLGHRRIAFLDHSHDQRYLKGAALPEHYSGRARYQGVCDEMAGAGLEPILEARRDGEDGLTMVRESVGRVRSLLQDERPTAIICYSSSALDTCLHAARDLKIEVPHQLSLIAFGHPINCYIGTEISTACSSTCLTLAEAEMGRQLVRILLHKTAEPGNKIPAVVVPFEFHPGATCAPAQLLA